MNITVQGLSYIKAEAKILHNLSCTFTAAKIHAVVGPSGSGKTTFLRMFNRLSDPTEGTILLNDRDIGSYEVTTLRRKIGMVFQQPVFFPGTVEENLIIGFRFLGRAPARVGEYLEKVGLPADFLSREIHSLSGGQKQQLAIARTLLLEPEVLLLDEPTSALDPKAVEQVEQLILDLNKADGLTCLWVSHDLQQVRRVSTTTTVLVNGELCRQEPTGDFVRSGIAQTLFGREGVVVS